MSLLTTSSQTVGPYVKIGFEWLKIDNLAPEEVSGERISIHGRVIDGDGVAVNDAIVELWQANGHGKYASPEDVQTKPAEPGFRGFGRVHTDRDGAFRFTTIKPGRVPGPDTTLQAPHIAVTVFMRGMLKHLWTQIYFPDEAANADDPVLKLVSPERRGTLIAKPSAMGKNVLEWNVVVQGQNETVFFDF